jgi:hypothetical protein
LIAHEQIVCRLLLLGKLQICRTGAGQHRGTAERLTLPGEGVCRW